MLNKRSKQFFKRIKIQSDISEKCGIHCLVFCYAMQKYKNKRSYANFLKTFLDLSIDEREHLSVYYFNLINQICSVWHVF